MTVSWLCIHLPGYDIGATSYVISQLQGQYAGVAWADEISRSDALKGLFTSAGVGGALLGTLLVFRVADALGRRRELMTAAVLYAMGALLEGASSVGALARTSSAGLVVAIVGRVVYGLGCGFAMHGVRGNCA
jgi:MFS family permease